MRFFNLDLHIAVISDIREILGSLGHEVTSWSLSGQAWVIGAPVRQVEIVNKRTWRGIDDAMCDAFYARYRDELSSYDGFIVAYPPAFAMLFRRWNKPIIIVAATRYEEPFSDDAAKWLRFNEFLRNGIDAGWLIPIANNRYDAAYAELFTERPWRVIPSICSYTGASYVGDKTEALYWSKYKPKPFLKDLMDRDLAFRMGKLGKTLWRLGFKRARGYRWSDLAHYRAIVHIPYNASVMSIFEHYTAGIPLFFPSRRFIGELYSAHGREGVLSELSFNQVRGLAPRSVLDAGPDDPNNHSDAATVMKWIALADYYDEQNLAHLQYFDSFDDLAAKLATLDPVAISEAMRKHGAVRREHALADWREVMAGVAQRL